MTGSDIVQGHSLPQPYAGEDWETLTRQADEVFGADLEKGDTLIGVPFLIVRATYRLGDITSPVTKVKGYYVSLDLIVGPAADLARAVRRGRVTEPLSVEPGEHLIINEGGTGAYRQVTEYLESRGQIELPEGPASGAYGISRFDAPLSKWGITGNRKISDDGEILSAEFDIRLYCPRGLRSSEYTNDYTQSGKTRYIA